MKSIKKVLFFAFCFCVMLFVAQGRTIKVQAASTPLTDTQIDDIITQYIKALDTNTKVYWNKGIRTAQGSTKTLMNDIDKINFNDQLNQNEINILKSHTTNNPCPSERYILNAYGESVQGPHFTAAAPPNCTSNVFTGAHDGFSQCAGFADYMAYIIFRTNESWPYATSVDGSYDFLSGDLIRADGHSYMIYKNEDGNLKKIECNYGSQCIIRWDRPVNADDLRKEINSGKAKLYFPPSNLRRGSKPSSSVPAIPQNFKANWMGNNTVSFVWGAVAGATRYEVRYRSEGTGWLWKTDSDYQKPYTATTFETKLVSYDVYGYQVRAINEAGASEWKKIEILKKDGSLYTCNHPKNTYEKGICKECNYEYPSDNGKDTKAAGKYVVTATNGYLKERPYSDPTGEDSKTKCSLKINDPILVDYSVVNCYDNIWYYTSDYNGYAGYIYSGDVEKCTHKEYDQYGLCSACDEPYPDEKDTTVTGTYKVTKAGNMKERPYSDSTGTVVKTICGLEIGKKVSVDYALVNKGGKRWYHTNNYNGHSGYIYEGDLEKYTGEVEPDSGSTTPVVSTPVPPTGLKVEWLPNWNVQISWNPVEGATSYNVLYTHAEKTVPAEDANYTDKNVTSFTSKGYNAKDKYTIYVQAVNSAGTSDESKCSVDVYKQATITLDPNGGSVSPNTHIVRYNNQAGTTADSYGGSAIIGTYGGYQNLPDPVRPGYNFAGWYLGNSLVKPETKRTSTSGTDTLTAQWTPISVTGVRLNQTSASLTVGNTLTLTVAVSPSDALNKAVSWSSNNSSVATVSNGVVTANSAGTATITVKTSDGSKTASCIVTVTDGENTDTPAGEYTAWDIAVPPAGSTGIESKTVYRYRSKQRTTTTNQILGSPWTQEGTDNVSYGAWSNIWSKTKINATNTLQVEGKTFYHYFGFYGTNQFGPYTHSSSSHPYLAEIWVEAELPKTRDIGTIPVYGDGRTTFTNPITGKSATYNKNPEWIQVKGTKYYGQGAVDAGLMSADDCVFTKTFYRSRFIATTRTYWKWNEWTADADPRNWTLITPSEYGAYDQYESATLYRYKVPEPTPAPTPEPTWEPAPTPIPDMGSELGISNMTNTVVSPATIIAPAEGWKEGDNVFTVVCEKPCYAAISHDGGATYMRLLATTSVNAYNYTAENMTADTILAVGYVGDVNGDGTVSNSDATRLAAIYANKTSATNALTSLLCDVNDDGQITNSDITGLRAGYAGKKKLNW